MMKSSNKREQLDDLAAVDIDLTLQELENSGINLDEEDIGEIVRELGNEGSGLEEEIEEIARAGKDILPDRDAELEVTVLNGGKEVSIKLFPPLGSGKFLEADSLRDRLRKGGVVFGIDDAALVEAIRCHREYKLVNDWTVARAASPVDGRDGYVEWKIEFDQQDRSIRPVEKGEVIAVIHPPAPGKPGTTVTGKKIGQKKGHPVELKWNENIKIAKKTGELRALVSGQVKRSPGTVDLIEKFYIPSDLDIAVGDVHFDGDIEVSGYVRSGMKLVAKGDITIEGGIESAVVISEKGNVFVGKGIQGSGKGVVSAAGNVEAKYIENARVTAGKEVVSRTAILHSRVIAGEKVTVEEGKGVLVGGETLAGKNVTVRHLGTSMGTRTDVSVGVKISFLDEWSKIGAEIAELETKEEKVVRVIQGLMHRFGNLEQVPEKIREKLVRLKQARLVLKFRVNKLKKKEAELYEKAVCRLDGEVRVLGALYPGVRIKIGGDPFSPVKEQKYCKIYWDKNKGIATGPLV